MGRGRGKGRKTTVVSHEDTGSGGEELFPTYRKRGRPQKALKDDVYEEEGDKIEEEGGDAKPAISSKEIKGLALVNGKKRKMHQQVKESPDSVVDEKGTGIQSSTDEVKALNGFRQNGRQRKNKPRRAAEAGVECKLHHQSP